MKNTSTTKTVLTLLMVVAYAIVACRKNPTPSGEQDLSKGHLTFTPGLQKNLDKKFMINQAIIVFDSTAKTDSFEVVAHANQYFKWEVMPENGCDSIIGNKHGYAANFIFYCSGAYKITAKIYDSASQNLIGITDTFALTVTSDTLHPTQPINKDDVLNIQAGVINGNYTNNETWIYLMLRSTKNYDTYGADIGFDTTSNISANNYSYTIRNIKLPSYPFIFPSYILTSQVVGRIDIKKLSIGAPANLSITWLGITYTGTITLLSNNQFTLNWNNSGAVIITR